MVADAVLLVICVVGVRRTEEATHILVVLGVLVGVAHEEADRTARGLALEDAREEFYLICLLTASGDGTLSGTATCHLVLYELHIDGDACWHAVDDATDACAVALTECGDGIYLSECIHCERPTPSLP